MTTAPLDAFGETLGIEEEYHLVDTRTFALRRSADLTARAMQGALGPRLRAEMLTSQLEAATDVCADLASARTAVIAMRAEAASAAADEGATILATSTHPLAGLDEIELVQRDRYARLVDRFGTVVGAFNLCGCHVHVSVPDLDSAVAVMTHARPYLPLLSAVTGSSPFHAGADTGYESFRIAWLSLWQQGGPPPHLETGAAYLDTIEQLVAAGLVDEASEVLWELRPSARYPTLEFRVADMCTDVDDALLFAGLVRGLVRTLAARVLAGTPAPVVNDAVLRAARWRAARYGLADTLWHPTERRLVPAAQALGALIDELRPALLHFGDEAAVTDRAARLLERGTSAQSQRERFAATGDLRTVIGDAVELTLRG